MAKWKSYTLNSVEKFIESLVSEHGYNEIVIDEGSLGLGQRALIPTEERKYIFLIREVYLNAWSSATQVMKVRRLPKEWEKAIMQLECA